MVNYEPRFNKSIFGQLFRYQVAQESGITEG